MFLYAIESNNLLIIGHHYGTKKKEMYFLSSIDALVALIYY